MSTQKCGWKIVSRPWGLFFFLKLNFLRMGFPLKFNCCLKEVLNLCCNHIQYLLIHTVLWLVWFMFPPQMKQTRVHLEPNLSFESFLMTASSSFVFDQTSIDSFPAFTPALNKQPNSPQLVRTTSNRLLVRALWKTLFTSVLPSAVFCIFSWPWMTSAFIGSSAGADSERCTAAGRPTREKCEKNAASEYEWKGKKKKQQLLI